MQEKHVVLVSRLWSHPEIRVDIVNEGIGLSMKLDDFLAALVQEVGNPTLLVTKNALAVKLTQASERVTAGMKAESTRAI